MERKLTAIFSADVKGYSRLMGDDEEATIRTLTVYREVMTTLIHQHRGRVVDSPGDNLLAEFASAVDAVQGAVEIQRELKVKNAELLDQRKMEYRTGINVGDVVVEGERLYAVREKRLPDGGERPVQEVRRPDHRRRGLFHCACEGNLRPTARGSWRIVRADMDCGHPRSQLQEVASPSPSFAAMFFPLAQR
jgi:hypothetical protein